MHPYKLKSGHWRAQVYRKGVRDSATFPTKAQAVAWGVKREAEILAGARGEIIPQTVAKALIKYATDISPSKLGARWEKVRLAKFGRTLPFRGMLMQDVRPIDIANWRDAAIAGGLAPSSVRREMVLLRSVFERARREWGTVGNSPMQGVHYPAHAPARKRRVTDDEIASLLLALGWGDGDLATRPSQRVAVAVLWAVETAMRAGEIVGLTWARIDPERRVATLPKTKNGDAREVPLSKRAIALLASLPRTDGDQDAPAFAISSASLDVLFRKARDKVGLKTIHFHDLRAEALTRMADKVDVLTLARIAGHRDIKSLMTYYRESATDIASKLD